MSGSTTAMSESLRCRSHWEERHCGWHAGTKIAHVVWQQALSWALPGLQAGRMAQRRPSCTRSSRGIVARPVSNSGHVAR
jgi:hypothetical protein